MSVKLGEVELIKAASVDPDSSQREIRSIDSMSILDKRNIVELPIPGSSGNVLQDMGPDPVKITFTGEMMGKDSTQTMERLFAKHNSGEVIDFHSDITAISDVSKVILEDFHVEGTQGSSSRYRYMMTLREYREPKKAATEDQGAEETQNKNEIDDIRGQVLDSEGNPAQGIKVKVKGPDGERELTTDENGYYEVLDAAEGTYEITFEGEEFADMKREVEIKKGEGESSGSGQSGEE
jgi:hypothetical protein